MHKTRGQRLDEYSTTEYTPQCDTKFVSDSDLDEGETTHMVSVPFEFEVTQAVVDEWNNFRIELPNSQRKLEILQTSPSNEVS